MQLAWRLTRGSPCHRETPQVFAFLRIVQRSAPASTTAEGGARKPQLCAIDKDVPAISKGRPVSSSDPRQNLVQVRHQRRRDCGRAVMSTGQDSPDFGMQVQPLDPNKLLLPRASSQVQPKIYTALQILVLLILLVLCSVFSDPIAPLPSIFARLGPPAVPSRAKFRVRLLDENPGSQRPLTRAETAFTMKIARPS